MLRLVPFTREDFSRMMSWAISPEFLVQWAGTFFTYPLTIEQLEKYYLDTQQPEPERLVYKAVDERGEVVGHIELSHIDRRNQSAHISRVLIVPEARGKGYGQYMMREMMRIGFEELKLHRIDLCVFDFNHSAIACYEKVGFIKEGVFRDRRKVGNEYWNLITMSMLEDEYRAKIAHQTIGTLSNKYQLGNNL